MHHGAAVIDMTSIEHAVDAPTIGGAWSEAAIVVALVELGFDLTDAEHAEIQRGKDFVQLMARETSRVSASRDWYRTAQQIVSVSLRIGDHRDRSLDVVARRPPGRY
jgi:hypothetical protein